MMTLIKYLVDFIHLPAEGSIAEAYLQRCQIPSFFRDMYD